jgi:pyridoxal phosphate enzyme (YggS family)
MNDISSTLLSIHHQIRRYEEKYGREAGSVSLLAVSKTQSAEIIQQAVACGQFCFGENYLQEALPKIIRFANTPIEWHFIGPLQSNKTKKIAEHFAWVHSLDTMKTAKRLHDQRPASLPPLQVCIEVNLHQEETKAGVHPHDMLALADYCMTLPRLTLRGLMAIPAMQKTFAEQRIAFAKIRWQWEMLRERGFPLDTLSMGMSADFEAAIAEGATIVRIGTALFGQRTSP